MWALNEGRGTHPGDTCGSRCLPRTPRIAQRRPGHAPRRHLSVACQRQSLHCTAQRRPGHAPRRHSGRHNEHPDVCPRSTKAGARTPATPPPMDRYATSLRPLNEGRGTHPGDTRCRASLRCTNARAQRRPGHAPRRHSHPAPCCRAIPCPLNEGRGTHPGDTWTPAPQGEPVDRRSTKAGARTPATLLPPALPTPQARARSTKAGARTPATRSHDSPSAPSCSSLNEGRGTHPGDTQSNSGCVPGVVAALNEGRGTHPGDTSSPASILRPRSRSTKAGARTPATRATSGSSASAATPLNEGRGTHPGDTH